MFLMEMVEQNTSWPLHCKKPAAVILPAAMGLFKFSETVTRKNYFHRENKEMKKLAMGLIASWILIVVAGATPKDRTFTGEIMDSQCANMGSHDTMIKKEAAKNAKECTTACLKMGGKYVLFNRATKTTYQLDDQQKPADFAGHKVKVTGSLDKATRTIHVTDIKAVT
jgi:hypothetical protein